VLAIVLTPALLLVHWSLSLSYLLVYAAWGGATQCRGCKRLFARVGDYSKVVDVESGYETVTRHDEVRAKTGDFFDDIQGGKRVGTIVRQEQVHVTYTTRRHYYSCRHCDHTWTERKTTSS